MTRWPLLAIINPSPIRTVGFESFIDLQFTIINRCINQLVFSHQSTVNWTCWINRFSCKETLIAQNSQAAQESSYDMRRLLRWLLIGYNRGTVLILMDINGKSLILSDGNCNAYYIIQLLVLFIKYLGDSLMLISMLLELVDHSPVIVSICNYDFRILK